MAALNQYRLQRIATVKITVPHKTEAIAFCKKKTARNSPIVNGRGQKAIKSILLLSSPILP